MLFSVHIEPSESILLAISSQRSLEPEIRNGSACSYFLMHFEKFS